MLNTHTKRSNKSKAIKICFFFRAFGSVQCVFHLSLINCDWSFRLLFGVIFTLYALIDCSACAQSRDFGLLRSYAWLKMKNWIYNGHLCRNLSHFFSVIWRWFTKMAEDCLWLYLHDPFQTILWCSYDDSIRKTSPYFSEMNNFFRLFPAFPSTQCDKKSFSFLINRSTGAPLGSLDIAK